MCFSFEETCIVINQQSSTPSKKRFQEQDGTRPKISIINRKRQWLTVNIRSKLQTKIQIINKLNEQLEGTMGRSTYALVRHMCKHVRGLMGNHLARVSNNPAMGMKLSGKDRHKVKPMSITTKKLASDLVDGKRNRTHACDICMGCTGGYFGRWSNHLHLLINRNGTNNWLMNNEKKMKFAKIKKVIKAWKVVIVFYKTVCSTMKF